MCLPLMTVLVKACSVAYYTRNPPKTTIITANFDPNIPLPDLTATDVLLSPPAVEVLALAPVLSAVLVSPFAVAVVIAVVIAVVVWTDVVRVTVVEVLVDTPAAVDGDEEAEAVAPELSMPNADCEAKVRPSGSQIVPGAQSITADHSPEAQRWNVLVMQYHAPSEPVQEVPTVI